MKKTIVRRKSAGAIKFSTQLHPVMQRIYANRGITEQSEIEKDLSGLFPFNTLLGIEPAVAILAEAITHQQRIIIIGDFDADGATSCAVAVTALRALGAQSVEYLVPNRFEYGYGLTPEIVAVAHKRTPDLIVTVDNGISSHAGIVAAKALGIRVLVTDHHLAGDSLPNADAIVNPNQPGCPFPSKNLAGVGVIFYVMLALRQHLRQMDWFATANIPEPNMAQYLDLVALGTVTDVVPLDKNNRIIVHHGIQRICAGVCRPGIQALIEIAGRKLEQIDASDLGFVVGPRLNAAGRLDDMSLGIECLLAEEPARARELAATLDKMNRERRTIEAEMHEQALMTLQRLDLSESKEELPSGHCFYDSNWHQGVIGIVASRMKDHLHRPVIAFAPMNDNEIKGSARSIPGVHIRDVLALIAARNPQMLSKFGGHAMAAGLSLATKDYMEFSKLFDEEVKHQLSPELLQNAVYSDGELTPADINIDLTTTIRSAGPWGQNFAAPLFDGHFRILDQRIVGAKHLKLLLGARDSQHRYDAIYFNANKDLWPNDLCQEIHAAYRLDINEYRGERRVQLVIEYMEPMVSDS